MKDRRIRHLPVLNGSDELIAMISIGDLNAWEIQHLESERRFIQHLRRLQRSDMQPSIAKYGSTYQSAGPPTEQRSALSRY